MRKLTKALAAAAILAVGVMAASSLYAQGDPGSSGMMKQMSQMADHCNNMMSHSRPNDQWRRNAPSEPEKKG